MSASRKPLHKDCTGGIYCPVPGHVSTALIGRSRSRTSHISLTGGQRKTLSERQRKPSAQQ